jgi:hypothetical protein
MAKFSEELLQKIWEKGKTVSGCDPDLIRKDDCGAWLSRSDYGNIESEYGWEADHIKPESSGGTNELWNLRPLHWVNKRYKGDNYPEYTSVLTAKGDKNILKAQEWKVQV